MSFSKKQQAMIAATGATVAAGIGKTFLDVCKIVAEEGNAAEREALAQAIEAVRNQVVSAFNAVAAAFRGDA